MNKSLKWAIIITIVFIILAPVFIDWSYDCFEKKIFIFPWDEASMLSYWGGALSAIATIVLGGAVFNQTQKNNELNAIAKYKSLIKTQKIIVKDLDKDEIKFLIFLKCENEYVPNKIQIKEILLSTGIEDSSITIDNNLNPIEAFIIDDDKMKQACISFSASKTAGQIEALKTIKIIELSLEYQNVFDVKTEQKDRLEFPKVNSETNGVYQFLPDEVLSLNRKYEYKKYKD